MAKTLYGNSEKMASEETSSSTFSVRIFHVCIIDKLNHMVFLIQFEIKLHLWVFLKLKFALAKAARAISAF